MEGLMEKEVSETRVFGWVCGGASVVFCDELNISTCLPWLETNILVGSVRKMAI